MTTPGGDLRSPGRRLRDEQIAAEPALAAPKLPPDMVPSPMEAHLGQDRKRPVAAGRAASPESVSQDPDLTTEHTEGHGTEPGRERADPQDRTPSASFRAFRGSIRDYH